ncbi:hypothetical protein ABFS82_14G035100 [Erythranthe guttata]
MKTFFSIIVLFLYLVHTAESMPSYLRKHHVYIYNQLPNNYKPLYIHCASGDDDFGHTLYSGQNFGWKFRSNIFGTTLYFCHFWCGSRQSAFEVFKADLPTVHNTYNYYVRSDGFYVNYGPGDDLKKLDDTWQ